jgi:hypothetical protein
MRLLIRALPNIWMRWLASGAVLLRQGREKANWETNQFLEHEVLTKACVKVARTVMKRLAAIPERAHPAPESASFDAAIRELPVGTGQLMNGTLR